jgi:nitrogen fixation protein NifX
MRIAIASTDGRTIDAQFEKAGGFYIYEMRNDDYFFLEKRETHCYAREITDLSFDQDRFDKVCDVIRDCRLLYINSIGEAPAYMLRRKGIYHEVVEGEIEEIFK